MSETIILLPVFKPNLNFLSVQLESIAKQTYRNFTCVVSYDGACDENFFSFFETKKPDQRFQIAEYETQVGVYRHIERLLSHVEKDTSFISLCDQDDFWNSSKLKSQIEFLKNSSSMLVTDNARLIDENGHAIGEKTLFQHLGISKLSVRYLLLTNCVTGAGTTFKSEILSKALPFPPDEGKAVHDHWLAVVAESCGGCSLRPELTWEYRQHSQNTIGLLGKNNLETRLTLAKKKFKEIIKSRSNTTFVLLRQLNVYEQTISSRELQFNKDFFCLANLKYYKRNYKLLLPHHLYRSRLETLRVFINGLSESS